MLIFPEGNDPKRKSHQPLDLFTPILLQYCLFIARAPKHKKSCNLVQWGDLVWTSGCEKWGSRRGPLHMGPVTRSFQAQVLWTACKQGYHLTLSLKSARHGAHALGACQNHTHFEPQIPPSANLLICSSTRFLLIVKVVRKLTSLMWQAGKHHHNIIDSK